MIHRKLNHNKMVSKCRDFKKGTCINNNEDCWYKHEALDKTNEKKDEGNSPNSVFRNVQENMHPPDMMKRMWDTIQQIMKKVDFLEKETKKKEQIKVKNVKKCLRKLTNLEITEKRIM